MPEFYTRLLCHAGTSIFDLLTGVGRCAEFCGFNVSSAEFAQNTLSSDAKNQGVSVASFSNSLSSFQPNARKFQLFGFEILDRSISSSLPQLSWRMHGRVHIDGTISTAQIEHYFLWEPRLRQTVWDQIDDVSSPRLMKHIKHYCFVRRLVRDTRARAAYAWPEHCGRHEEHLYIFRPGRRSITIPKFDLCCGIALGSTNALALTDDGLEGPVSPAVGPMEV